MKALPATLVAVMNVPTSASSECSSSGAAGGEKGEDARLWCLGLPPKLKCEIICSRIAPPGYSDG